MIWGIIRRNLASSQSVSRIKHPAIRPRGYGQNELLSNGKGCRHAVGSFSYCTSLGSQCCRAYSNKPRREITAMLRPEYFIPLRSRSFSSDTGDLVDAVVPFMGESITDGTLAKFLKNPGDRVEVDEPIAQIETDKVTIDVASPEAGTIQQLVAKEGETVEPGTKIAVISKSGEGVPQAAPPSQEKTASQPPPPAEKESIGKGTTKTETSSLKGKEKTLFPPQPAARAPSSPPKPSEPQLPPKERERRVPMTRLRKRVATRLKDSQNTFAMLTTFNEVDMTNLMKLRSDYKDAFVEKHGVKFGFMSGFVKATVSALQYQPVVNAVIDGDDIIYRDYIDISIAVGTPKTMVVGCHQQPTIAAIFFDNGSHIIGNIPTGYGLHQDAEPIEDARKRVSVAIENLKDCCMLLGTETEEHVRMHDLVRDFAIQIASSEEYGFMVKAGIGLEKWPMRNKSFEGCTAISLMGNTLAELPEGLVCPKLKVLLLEVEDGLYVPQRFFEGMKEIEVLSLMGGCLSLQSLELSTKLQSLVLMECGCKDLIRLRKLQRLKILGLMWCLSIEELPDEIGELKELRLLDVTGCRRLRRIPVNLIGRLKKLEELLIGEYSFEEWDVDGTSTGGMNASLTELNSLSQLAVLSLRIPKVECIPRDFVFPSLRKYDIVLGNRFVAGRYPTSTTLISTAGTSLNAKTFEQLFLHKLESVQVSSCGDVFTLFPARLRQGLKNLKEVIVDRCKSLEEVFELGEADEQSNEEKEMPLLSSLTELQLEMLPELKCIWKGPTGHVSLQNLARLELGYLHKLTFIFTAPLAQSLPKLERLNIRKCGELKHIIREEDGERKIIPQSPGFPKLKTIIIEECGKLEYVFPVSVSLTLQSLPQLQTLDITACGELKHIIREEDGEREIVPESPGFLKIKTLRISYCGKLEYVFPVSMSSSLPNLEQMTIARADNLKQIFYGGEGDALTRDGIIKFPQLRELSLRLRSNYSFLGPRNFDAQLPLQELTIEGHEEVGNWLAQLQQNGFVQRLELVQVDDCGDVLTPFPAKLLRALKNLRRVNISNCKSLEEVFELGEADEGSSEEKELLSSLKELHLKWLPELKYIWKGPTRHVRYLEKMTFIFRPSLAQSLPRLERLYISKCSELKHIIREENGEMEIIPESSGFPKLKKIFIEDCGKLEYVLPVPVTVPVSPSLLNLEEMRIFKAHNLKQIFYSGEGDALTTDGIIKFPRLRQLDVSSRSNYRFFGPTNFAVQLPSLQILEIDGHKELGNLLAQLQGLTNLEKLRLESLPDMRCIWKGLVLSKLTTLEMAAHGEQNGSLQRLECVPVNECGDFTAKLLHALKTLKSVDIESCKSLEEVFELGEADEGSSEEKELPLLSSLTELHLSFLPELKCIWKGPTRHVSLQSLARLELGYLDKLTFIFTPSLAQSLLKLEKLEIEKCGELKHIIREEDGDRDIIPESPRFPKLKTLIVSGCGKLEYVFPVSVSVSPSLPNLEKMTISDADNLKQMFYSGEGDTLTTDGIIKFPQLSELDLSSRSNYSFFGPKNFAAQLPSLKSLTIYGHKELEKFFAQLQGLTNLETFRLSSLPDMRCIWKGLVLSKLTTLEVFKCKRLTHVFTCSMIVSLVQLKVLRILFCEELEQIIARDNDDEKDQILPGDHLKSLRFPNLCEIEIRECNKLKSLFPVAMASGLPNLQILRVTKASQLLRVFGQDDHASPVNVEKEMVLLI